MLVTVLMPVYNGAPYLREAIESILAQTYINFEFIIINDGSTDDTEKIIKSYKDERIRYHYHPNMGVSRSLNKGIGMAMGEYIRRHDADDISEPDMLEKQMQFLSDHPEISFVSTQCAFMTNRSKIANKYRQPKIPLFENKEYQIVKKEQFNPYSPIVHGTVLGSTSIFKEMGGYRTEFLTSEDNDLWLRIIEKYQFAVLNDCPYYLRLSSTSATQMHKASVPFYRQMAIEFANERAATGSDPLTRGEPMPEPPVHSAVDMPKTLKGKYYRNDLLDFHYKVMLNAGDWKNVCKCVYLAVKDGWRLRQTWKGILFPILGDKLVQNGVNIKKAFRRH